MDGKSKEAPAADVLVVGAGIAGLMAATRLQEAGLRVTVVDKGRGVGGRMATRRIGPGRADHGAQFFTVRSTIFGQHVARWRAEGLVYEWSEGFAADPSVESAPDDGHVRYAISDGFTTVPKHLARSLDVRTGVTLAKIAPRPSGWEAVDQTGERYMANALIMTPPVPQSLVLLDAGGTTLAAADRAELERVRYAPCLCGLFWVDGEVHLPPPGALQRDEHAIRWIADNRRKGISPAARLITVHAGPDYSRRHWERPHGEALETVRAGLLPFLDDQAIVREAQLKRWRYALPLDIVPERTLRAAVLPPLAFAGDAFNGPRVEGAALSGLAAADSLLET